MNPLIEVRDVLKGTARGLYAIHREGAAPPLRIEHWRFSARAPAGFAPQGEGSPMLRLDRDDPRADDLEGFRTFAATPGNTTLRRDTFDDERDRKYRMVISVGYQVRAAKMRLRCTEVPVRYRRRIGVSKVSGTVRGTILAGHKILWTIFKLL